ncbi:MAG: Asp23/Gls24 family envelope stress response protein [Lachnospiraceae bacterium]|nr:Asp23/Gls24 family envelope stress response protein [Lachnospiraceae bacterium]
MSKEISKENVLVINHREMGDVRIADDVVAVIAALAAGEVEGVSTMEGGIGKTIMGYVGMKSKSHNRGVKVEVKDNIVRADIVINVSYGKSIPEVSQRVQEKVKVAIETMTELKVERVNIRVANIEMEGTAHS